MQSLRTLLRGTVDYAGLFPPARLAMAATVHNYAEYRHGPHAWMLGRLIVPVARLSEFAEAAGDLLAETSGAPWRISALIGHDLDADIDAIFEFNRRHAAADGAEGGAVIDTIELKVSCSSEIDMAMDIIPEQLEPFMELPQRGDPRGLIAALAGTGARAKFRTGGVTAELYPSSEEVARFMAHCAAAGVAFKATAGLHHPIRGERALTYAADAPRGVMHGFFNLFIAAALLQSKRLDEAEAISVLEEDDAAAFSFDEDGVAWREHRVDEAQIVRMREALALSFGSCSFAEPLEDLQGMGLL